MTTGRNGEQITTITNGQLTKRQNQNRSNYAPEIHSMKTTNDQTLPTKEQSFVFRKGDASLGTEDTCHYYGTNTEVPQTLQPKLSFEAQQELYHDMITITDGQGNKITED